MSAIVHFIVIGAQKSGTTSLCSFLEAIPGLCLSRPKEPMFFSRDELALHPHFFAEHPQEWFTFDWDQQREKLLEQYQTYFAHATPDALRGEGSTSYLLSQRAPERLFGLNPQAKIIAVLRDPAARAYSAYWHYVKHGIACENFERHLRYEGGHTVSGGEYAIPIAKWLSVFPRSQCHFMLYEAMLADPATHLKALCDFLGVSCPASPALPRENAGKTPRLLWLQLWLNRLHRACGGDRGAFGDQSASHWLQQAFAPLEQWNLMKAPPAPMPHRLHHALDLHYSRANAALESLTGLNVQPYWYETLR